MRIPILASVLLLTAPTLWSQTVDERIAAVNAVFGGAVHMKMDKQQRLVIDFFDGSNRFRQDLVLLVQLDTLAVAFSPEEDAVVIGCLAAHGQCIDKEIFKLNAIRRTGRSNLPRPPQDPGGEQAMAALKDLITTAQEQLATVPNETRERTVRRK
ncbi:MAG: hypothetical protein ABI432_14255 [Flavobacteriales bacterium]